MGQIQNIHNSTAAIDLKSTALGFSVSNWPIATIQADADSAWERLTLTLRGSDHDNLQAQLAALNLYLDQANDWSEGEAVDAVYLTDQLTNESAARYGPIVEARYVEPPVSAQQPEVRDSNTWAGLIMEVRRKHWQSAAPGSLGNAKTLSYADHPLASPTLIPLRNALGINSITHIYEYDASAGAPWSGNLVAQTAWTIFEQQGNTAAVGDRIMVGANIGPFHNVIWNLTTLAAVIGGATPGPNLTLAFYYSTGAAWKLFSAATTPGDLFCDNTGAFHGARSRPASWSMFAWSWHGPSDWASWDPGSGAAAYYVMAEITNIRTPGLAMAAQSAQKLYTAKTPYYSIPAATFGGDVNPLLANEIHALTGHFEIPAVADPVNIHGLVIGPKEQGDGHFQSRISLGTNSGDFFILPKIGGGEPAGTDTIIKVVSPESPSGRKSTVSFATDESLVYRVATQKTLLAGFDDWVGEYVCWVSVKQLGGAAGNVQVQLRAKTGMIDDYDYVSDVVSLKTFDAFESVAFGLVRIPNTSRPNFRTMKYLRWELWASRTAGTAATLETFELAVIPAERLIFIHSESASNPGAGLSNQLDFAVRLGGGATPTGIEASRQVLLDGGLIRPWPGVELEIAENTYALDNTDPAPRSIWSFRSGGMYETWPGELVDVHYYMIDYGGAPNANPVSANPYLITGLEQYGVSRYRQLKGADA